MVAPLRIATVVWLCGLACCVVAQEAAVPAGFVDYGVGAKVAEGGGVVTTTDANGHCLAIANSQDLSPIGWIVVTDLDTGTTEQIYHPPDVAHAWPYGSIMASNGMFYTANGNIFLEFDPNKREFTYHGKPDPAAGCYLWMIEDPKGVIWAGNAYTSGLISFDPRTREARDHGRLDPVEKYCSRLAADDEGWIYGGIGTARCNIIAYNPATGEKRQIVPEDKRTLSSGTVYRGIDSKVYGQASLTDGPQFYRMSAGQAEVIEKADMAKEAPCGSIYYSQTRSVCPDGRQMTHNMLQKWIDVKDPRTGQNKRITFDYKTEGLLITSLGDGPDGAVFGSTCHPMHLLRLDTKAQTLQDMGPVPRVGGGNFCAITCHGNEVIGAEYASGSLWAYDVTKPWNPVGAKHRTLGVPAEQLVREGECKDGHFTYLTSHDVAFLCGDKFGAEGTLKLNAPADGRYYLQFVPYKADGYCMAQFLFDGNEVGKPYAAFSNSVEPDVMQTYGPFELKAGEHRLAMRTLATEGQQPWCALVTAALSREKLDTLIVTEAANPRVLATWHKDICRPRTALAHPDGKHVMMAGFPGYGLCGGGIGIYNLETGEETLLTAEKDLLPGQNTITLKALPNGDLVGGTSIQGSGGGHSTETEAVLYILDWKTKKIVFKTVPVPGDGNIISIQVAGDGLVYCLSGNSTFFVFDPNSRQIVHSESFGEYGGPPRHALQLGPDGNLYAMMSKAIVKITPGTFAHEKLADAPMGITAGGALVNGLLCFASGSHVWSYQVPGLK